jgi:calcineurin-like phosphoesterase
VFVEKKNFSTRPLHFEKTTFGQTHENINLKLTLIDVRRITGRNGEIPKELSCFDFFLNFKMKKKKKLAKNNRYIIIVRASAAPSYFYTLPVEDIVSLIIGR